MTLVGEGFVIAEPDGVAAATPQVGNVAIVASGVRGPAVADKLIGAVTEKRMQTPDEQLARLRDAASGGDVAAMFLLGTYYRYGPDLTGAAGEKNLDQALHWYRLAAEKGEAHAMTALGFLQQSARNLGEAESWFRKAAETGDAVAMYALSQLLAPRAKNWSAIEVERLRWLRRAAEKGEMMAAFDLGEMYLKGSDGVSADPVEAAKWYRKAADKGLPHAMVQLGVLYGAGKGVPKDPGEQFVWVEAAAKAGHPLAMYGLGDLYLRGDGIAKDFAEAMLWFQKAADLGEPEAMHGLSYVYHFGVGVRRDPALAADWMIKAIRAGGLTAALNVISKSSAFSLEFRKELQKRLQTAGVYRGPINGVIDAATRKAIAELTRQALQAER